MERLLFQNTTPEPRSWLWITHMENTLDHDKTEEGFPKDQGHFGLLAYLAQLGAAFEEVFRKNRP